MRTYIEKYRRPLLAIFGVVLMIVFILPPTFKNMGGERSNPVVGHIGKDAVHAADISNAEGAWDAVTKRVVVQIPLPTGQGAQWVPLAYAELGVPTAKLISDHKDSFFLLQKEAENHGITVTEQEVEQLLEEPSLGVVDHRSNRVVAFSDLDDLDDADRIKASVARLLLVVHGFENAADVVKVSRPLRQYRADEQLKSATLELVDVPASDFKSASSPTPQQMEEQFKKYAAVSNTDLDRSPLGYGYKFPDRVKLQTIEIPMAQVRQAAERRRNKDDKTQYEWEKDAYRYYMEHQADFSSAPTTGPTTLAAKSQPTTRPFEAVKEAAKSEVLKADVNQLAQRIQERISNAMTSDYLTFKNTPPGKTAASSVGVPFNSFEYLQRLAADVQKTFGVLPVINSYNDYLDEQALSTLPGIGQTAVGEPGREESFPRYVLHYGTAFLPAAERDSAEALSPFEPSPVIHDEEGNAYLFRITDMQPAHPPASLSEVAAAVEKDVRSAASYAQAKAAAEQILAQAQQAGGLESAAVAAKRKVINTGTVQFAPLQFNVPPALDTLHLSPIAAESFRRQAFALVASASSQKPHPMGLIELPRVGHCLVARVVSSQSQVTTPQQMAIVDVQAGQAVRSDMQRQIAADWFNPESIAARLNYTPAKTEPKPGEQQPANNAPPAGQPLL